MELVFKGVGKSDIAGLLHKSTMFLINSASSEVPFYQFARYFSSDMDKIMMDRVLFTLESTKAIKMVRRPGADDIIKVLAQID